MDILYLIIEKINILVDVSTHYAYIKLLTFQEKCICVFFSNPLILVTTQLVIGFVRSLLLVMLIVATKA